MAFIQQYIAKGIYPYSQIENFISVKDYMFVRSDDKKCLMFRFSNNANYMITSLEFTIVQLDNSGKKISETRHKYEQLTIAPDAQFVPNEGIVVDERCHDFKIFFTEVRSDKYRYTVRHGKILVYYDSDYVQATSAKVSNRSVCNDVRKLKVGKPRLAILVSAIALLLVIVLNASNMITKYYDYSNKRDFETQEDRFEIVTGEWVSIMPMPEEFEAITYVPISGNPSDIYEVATFAPISETIPVEEFETTEISQG